MIVIKKLWLIVGLVGVALLVGGWYFLLEEEIYGPSPQYVLQTITGDSRSSRTVVWQTEPTEVVQKLVYREGDAGEEVTLQAQAQPLATGAEAMSVYAVTLRNLKPEIAYQYKVGGKENWSDWQALRTEETVPQEFKALIFGDSQSENYGVWAATAQNAWQRNSDARFFVNMGDLVDIGSHYAQWKAWFDGGAGMISSIPAATTSGNHENYLPGGAFSPAQLYLEFFRLPENGPAGMKGQAYSFDYGDAHFVALDSQEEELAQFQPELIERERAWLEADLKSTQKPWKVVIIHRSLFENNREGTLNALGKRLMPVFDRFQVDVVFTAHIHTYGRSDPLIAGKPVKGNARGTVYISTGRSGDKTWEQSKQKYFERVFDHCLDQPNYLTLEVAANRMKITNFKQDGRLVDAVELRR